MDTSGRVFELLGRNNGRFALRDTPNGDPIAYVCADGSVMCGECADRFAYALTNGTLACVTDAKWIIVDMFTMSGFHKHRSRACRQCSRDISEI